MAKQVGRVQEKAYFTTKTLALGRPQAFQLITLIRLGKITWQISKNSKFYYKMAVPR